jgi:hypothetical protein
MSDAEVGTCALCGQTMIRTDDDCWHPYNVKKACPPELQWRFPGDPDAVAAWQELRAKGIRPGRPGREHFRELA